MRKSTATVGGGCLLLIFAVGAIIGAVCWPYTINTWLVFVGKAAVVKWWQGALIGLVPGIGQASIIVAVLTWIIMLIIS